ncbi:MAG: NAD(P)/FAD-dependent oxidoreductase, partial [Acidimicrobiales bacterium]
MPTPDPRQLLTSTVVIAGAGLAGDRAAQTLRKEGFDGRVVLVSDEDVRPYDRPPLSKGYLSGSASFDRIALHKAGYYADRGIELLISTRATSLDVANQRLELDSGHSLAYDQLLLATGARPRRLDLPGSDLEGVYYLRDFHDAEHIRAALGPGGRSPAGGQGPTRLVVIGAGWIGTEVAASARRLGADVAIIDVVHAPLERVLGSEVGGIFARLHAEHGVSLYMGVGVAALRGGPAVREVLLADGTVVEADLVVIGVGVIPRDGLARQAGLVVGDGIVVDEYLATSAPGVWAAGDVASAYHRTYGRQVRLEHWAAATGQGPAVARNILGDHKPYDRTPYCWSDQYDLSAEYTGYAPTWDQVVVRADGTDGQV